MSDLNKTKPPRAYEASNAYSMGKRTMAGSTYGAAG